MIQKRAWCAYSRDTSPFTFARPASEQRDSADRAAERAVLELLGSPEPPTAVLAMSDALAAGTMAACRGRGLTVPADLSVVGFDDSPLAQMTVPPLTTVAQPLTEKGLRAARALTTLVGSYGGRTPPPGASGELAARRELLPAHLEVRETTAPPTQR